MFVVSFSHTKKRELLLKVIYSENLYSNLKKTELIKRVNTHKIAHTDTTLTLRLETSLRTSFLAFGGRYVFSRSCKKFVELTLTT